MAMHDGSVRRTVVWCLRIAAVCFLWTGAGLKAGPSGEHLAGKTLDPQGAPIGDVHLRLADLTGRAASETTSDSQGNFDFGEVSPGTYSVTGEISAFAPVTIQVSVVAGQSQEITLQFEQIASLRQAVTVVGSPTPSVLTPDPADHVFVHDELLDANPGRPGAPVSLPGFPIETASGGIKAPQYFAPGVAGDHGEPIAQFYQVGDFLYPNNLPANAHGNGYSDPNFLIAPIIEAVTVDGGAFNVREGNHSVDLAAAYVPRQRLDNFIELTGDYRDIDLVAGWSPSDPDTNGWMA